jgi:hypothetical protein
VRVWHTGEQEYGGQVLLRLIVLDTDEGVELDGNQAREEFAAGLLAAPTSSTGGPRQRDEELDQANPLSSE